MANRRYEAGRRFEWKVRDRLRAAGFTVLRTAGSKGPVDLIAVRERTMVLGVEETPGEIRFVQCKNRKPTAAERRAATAFARVLFGVSDEATMWLAWTDRAESPAKVYFEELLA